jgi:hypothetical protein
MDQGDAPVAFLGGFDKFIAGDNVGCHRFFQKDMFSGFKGRDCEGDVQVIGDDDIDNVDVPACKNFEMIRRDPALRMVLLSLPGRVLRLARDGDEFVIRQ